MRPLLRHRTLHIALLIALLCMVGLLAFGDPTLGARDERPLLYKTTLYP